MRSRPGVFRRGLKLGARRYPLSPPIDRSTELVRTGLGQGRWLTPESFGFWPREGPGYNGFEFAWVGLALVRNGALTLETRLPPGLVVNGLAGLLMAIALPVTFADFGMVWCVLALAVAALGVRAGWRSFQRQRRVAQEVMKEVGTRLVQSSS